MIFIGPELSDPHAHFVTNIVACIGADNDLIIDLYQMNRWEEIKVSIAAHLGTHDESYVIYNAYEDEDFFLYLKHDFPALKLITVFSDDEWRHANYDRYLALYSDIFTIAVKDNLSAYRSYGLEPFYMQWACNPDMFYPVTDQLKDIDISFVGAAYGKRVEYVEFLIANGVQVKVFGRRWDKHASTRPYWGGYLTHKEMLVVIARSQISLNFLWTSADKERCTIKARTLELSACQAFQLSNHTDEFSNYGFFDKKNIAVFNDQKNLLEKVRYYLNHEDDREAIAQRAYEHVLKSHTWQQRFQDVFEQLECQPSVCDVKKHQIVVVLKHGVQHDICCDDDRLDIKILDSNTDWRGQLDGPDGVVYLTHDSSINNETLYMMAFGLCADQADMIAANFYVGDDEHRTWIRFRDRLIATKPNLLRLLPQESLMFSSDYVSKYGFDLSSALEKGKVSYIEHPSFGVNLSYFWSRRLKLYFAHHRDPRNLLHHYVRSLQWGKALSLGVDKVWQKYQERRL